MCAQANLLCEQREADRASFLRPRASREREGPCNRERLSKAIDQYFDVFTSGYGDDSGLPTHNCGGLECCADDAACLHKMEAAIVAMPLRHSPLPPSSAKWTKTGPSVDYYMTSNVGSSMMLARLLVFAMAPFKMEQAAHRPAGGQENADDVDWKSVAGKRCPWAESAPTSWPALRFQMRSRS